MVEEFYTVRTYLDLHWGQTGLAGDVGSCREGWAAYGAGSWHRVCNRMQALYQPDDVSIGEIVWLA